MDKLIEIRWHGRGGQGAKTAALLLADAAFQSGKYVQGFPEYGSERMGAPITAYTRISNEKISLHCNIDEPDYVVVVDDSLLSCVDVCSGMHEEGNLIVNSEKNAHELRRFVPAYHGKIYTVDARRISMDTLGNYFPNVPMLGAMVKICGIFDEKQFLQDIRASFAHKFARKPALIEGNMQALQRAMQEVQSA